MKLKKNNSTSKKLAADGAMCLFGQFSMFNTIYGVLRWGAARSIIQTRGMDRKRIDIDNADGKVIPVT
jgi:hypothetical protein